MLQSLRMQTGDSVSYPDVSVVSYVLFGNDLFVGPPRPRAPRPLGGEGGGHVPPGEGVVNFKVGQDIKWAAASSPGRRAPNPRAAGCDLRPTIAI